VSAIPVDPPIRRPGAPSGPLEVRHGPDKGCGARRGDCVRGGDQDWACLFGRSDAQTPLTHFSTELVDTAAAATPDLDISAVARPYRQVRRSAIADPQTATPLVEAPAL
jgi:hypothetical protein